MSKIILDLCGGTGSWSKPYADKGYDVRNITLPEYDVMTYEPPDNVYGILATPPCPMFSFCRTNAKKPRNLQQGMELVIACLNIVWQCQSRLNSDLQKYPPLKFWVLENPNGMLKWFLGKPSLEFNPYDFGDDYKKKTHLWGWFNEPKKHPIKCTKPKFDQLPTKEIHGEYYNKLTRTERRSITPLGFAQAFFAANQ
jgi:site-specific DNA-cytosine methylase